MIRAIIYAACSWLLILPASLGAQEYAVSAIPEELLRDAKVVVREEVKHIEIKSAREGRLYWKRVITLLKPDAGAGTLFVLYDQESKVDKIQAAIYDAEGRLLRRIERNEIKDESAVSNFSIYEDNRVKYIEARHGQYPYTLSFEYEQTLSGINFAVMPDWQVADFGYAVQKASFSVDAPSGFPLHFKSMNLKVEPALSDDGKRRRHSWEINHLPAQKEEAYGPLPGESLPGILLSPGQFQIGAYSGGMDSWSNFGAFMWKLYEGRGALPPAIAADIQALTADAGPNSEKIRLLYQYLQKNMRYVSVQLGIGGWQPFDAQYVGARKYGDCKALTNFMMAILAQAGIESYPVLIKAGDLFFDLQEDFATSRFNHVVLYVPEENCWLECTSSDFPVNYLGWDNSDRNVLLLSPKGGKLLRTPVLSAAQNLEVFRAEVSLEADGSARIAVQHRSTGADHEPYRYLARHASAEDQQKWLQKNSSLPTFSIEALQIVAAADQPEAEMRFQVKAPRFASVAGKRLFVPLNGLHPFSSIPDEETDRRHAISRRRGYVEQDTFILKLPETYQVEAASGDGLLLEGDFGQYSLKIERAEGLLRIFRRLELPAGAWPASRFGEFRNFLREVARADQQKIVLVQKRT